jgi:FAD/FMN-containing dehydrogenase
MPDLPIIWRSDPAYEEARVGSLFNRRLAARYPLAIITATQEKHIIDAVKLAIENDYRIAIRSGGHSWPAWSLRENSIMIDLKEYHEMTLDDKTGIVTVSPSTRSGELNEYLLGKGRMFAGGHCGNVGLGGFLLQGGCGWNTRVRN